MIRLLFVYIIIIVLCLSACASPPRKEITINGNQYRDPNKPSLSIDFPFNVFLVTESTMYENAGDVNITNKYKVLAVPEDNTITVITSKISIDHTHGYFTGVNYENERLFYSDKRSTSDGCYVRYLEDGTEKYISSEIIKYNFHNRAVNIRILKKLYTKKGFEDIKVDFKEDVELMTSHLKIVCEQIFPQQ